MDKNAVTDAIKFLEQNLINSGLNISKIILFGSQAREQANEESDIDIVIISDKQASRYVLCKPDNNILPTFKFNIVELLCCQ